MSGFEAARPHICRVKDTTVAVETGLSVSPSMTPTSSSKGPMLSVFTKLLVLESLSLAILVPDMYICRTVCLLTTEATAITKSGIIRSPALVLHTGMSSGPGAWNDVASISDRQSYGFRVGTESS